MKSAYDGCVVVRDVDAELLNALSTRLVEMGYRGAAFSTSNPRTAKALRKILRKLVSETGLDLAARLELATTDRAFAKRVLRKYRRSFELISIQPDSRAMASFACRDRRVDIVTLNPARYVPLYRGDWEYLREEEKLVEVRVYPLLAAADALIAAKLLGTYSLWIAGAPKTMLNRFVVTSGAPSLRYLLTPFGLLDVAVMLGLPGPGFEVITEKVEINRDKISGIIPVPGVRILRRGNDAREGEEKVRAD